MAGIMEQKGPVKRKKKKKPHPAVDYLFYVLVRVLAIFFQLVEVDAMLRGARMMGQWLYRVYGRGRQRALENLRRSYPEKSEAWVQRTARRSFEHLAMFGFDILYADRLIRESTWHRYVSWRDSDAQLLLETWLTGRGLVLVTGHYGDFEVMARVMAALGLRSANVARPIDNPYINHYVYDVLHREQEIIYKKGASGAMTEVLERGGALGIVADQNGKRKDVFVDFFGRKAATYKSIGLLAMQYEVPIVVGCARRIGDRFQFELGIERIIWPADWQDREDPLRWVTEEYTAGIESFIRTDPEQYWWVHRRWKTRPPGETADVAAGHIGERVSGNPAEKVSGKVGQKAAGKADGRGCGDGPYGNVDTRPTGKVDPDAAG